MSKDEKLNELMKANPKALADSQKVERAMDAVRQRREAGFGPKGYDLATPFGNRSWVRQIKSSISK